MAVYVWAVCGLIDQFCLCLTVQYNELILFLMSIFGHQTVQFKKHFNVYFIFGSQRYPLLKLVQINLSYIKNKQFPHFNYPQCVSGNYNDLVVKRKLLFLWQLLCMWSRWHILCLWLLSGYVELNIISVKWDNRIQGRK